MSSDAFVLSATCSADPVAAARGALEQCGVRPSRVQDVVFGADRPISGAEVSDTMSAAGIVCPVAVVSSSLRAVFFAAQSILSGDVQTAMVLGLDGSGSAGLVLAAAQSIGRWNLLPRARLAARSLTGMDGALQAAGITSGDVEIVKEGDGSARLLSDALDELEARQAHWALVSAGELALLLERT